MCYYTATICNDGDRQQIVVHWDDNDPNRFIYASIVVDHHITDVHFIDDAGDEQGPCGRRI